MKAMRRRWIVLLLVLIGLVAGSATFLLPPAVSSDAIERSVTRTPALMEKAWRLPVAAAFGGAVTWQSNASTCGPASLANVFRSLADRTASEKAVLDDTGMCWTSYCVIGLSLDELADLARLKTTRKVTVLRDLSAEQFQEHLRRSNDPHFRYIVNFDRARIFGAGAGHHSPIGGYLENEDLVLVLDVNRNFGPWLIERKRLFAALDTEDGGRKRGLLLIEGP